MAYIPKSEAEKPRKKNLKQHTDFKSWMEYVKYLHEQGALAPDLEEKYFGKTKKVENEDPSDRMGNDGAPEGHKKQTYKIPYSE